MDYKTYLDLILALEDKCHPQSLAYFWRVLDIDKSGRLSTKVIEYFYKDIFTIVYELGGRRPDFNNMQQLYQKYKDLTYYFTRKKIQLARHNMPCNYMLLDILLRECNHTPYYNLPYLKNINLRDTVIHIFNELRNDQESS
jgi:hypothetical protein